MYFLMGGSSGNGSVASLLPCPMLTVNICLVHNAANKLPMGTGCGERERERERKEISSSAGLQKYSALLLLL